MNDDLERNLRDSLDCHAATAGDPHAEIGDVYARVDRRRARRRSVAVIGSVAVAVTGVVGVAALMTSELDQAVGTPDDGRVEPTATFVPSLVSTWSCSGYLGPDGSGRDLYSDCYPVSYTDPVPCTAPPTVPVTTAAIDPESGVGVVTTVVACAIAPIGYDPNCIPIGTAPPTTGPTIDTAVDMTLPPVVDACALAVPSVPYTSVPYAIGTAPPVTMAELPASVPTTGPLDCRGALANVTTTTIVTPPTTHAEQVYIVVAGDSLHAIAERFSVAAEVIANYNGWPDCLDHVIVPGERVLIPPGAAVPEG